LSAVSLLRSSIRDLKPYEPEAAQGEIALDANENPYAPPLAFLDAASKAISDLKLNRYPDPSCHALLEGASGYYGIESPSLLPGNGSDEFIASLFVAFGGRGKRCLLARPSFSMYALCARVAGWEVLEENLGPHWELTPSFVERAKKEKPDLIVLASPNNPTGNRFDDKLLDELLGLGGILVLDEAYAEFASKNRSKEATERENLIVLRTMSKAFGLAALRLGFLIARPEMVREMNKLRLPYNIDALAQTLGSLAFKMRSDFAPSLQRIQSDKLRLEAGLKTLKALEFFESDANFFLFRMPGAKEFHRHLLDRGLRLRQFSGAVLENCLRISVGSTNEVDRCLAAFKEWSS
jgi:histidinol-phosphate aminotransferase